MKKHRLAGKARSFVLLFLFLAFVFSCKSAAGRIDAPPAPDSPPPVPAIEEAEEESGEEPPAGDAGFPLPEASAPETGSPGEEAPPADEIPSETPFAGEPDLALAGVLPEPFMDLPEIDAEEAPPGETPFDIALPAPVTPILPEPVVSADVLPQAPELQSALPEPLPLPPPAPAPAPQAPQQAPPPAPAPAPQAPRQTPPPASSPPPASVPEQPVQISPAPPPFIRPAEEAPDSGRTVPPPSPVPAAPAEPPAWTRQNQAESRPQAAPPAEPSPLAAEEGINFSRIVRATVGQLVEIPFRGTGWVYLGEMGFRQGLVYGSRRLDPEGQSFIFRAEAAGTYGLKFYKQDFVRDYILNDYVQVIVGESPEAAATGWFNPVTDRGRAIAEPRWPTAAEEAEAFRNREGAGAGGANPAGASPPPASPPASPAQIAGRTDTPPPPVPAAGPAQGADLSGRSGAPMPAASVPAVPAAAVPAPAEPVPAETPPPAPPEEDSPDQYLRRAREEFDAGRVAPAIALLDRFRERFPAGSDETWWLYGQFYEANSPSRDIRSSLDYYRRLLREYPQSSRCTEARKRIAYLERYYINIR
jgi:hypothetical protein